MGKQDIIDITAEVDSIIDAAQRSGWSSAKVRSELGSIRNYMDQIGGHTVPLLESCPSPEPDPGPDPTPGARQYRGVSVTYPTHGQARDTYIGLEDDEIEWGPHDGYPLVAPCDGVVSLYQFGTPLPALKQLLVSDEEYAANHAALFNEWVCIAPPAVDPDGTIRYGAGQTMNVLVFVPSSPINTGYGWVRALWHGHVRNQCATGRMSRGDIFGFVGASGIQFERIGIATARAAHSHACASATGQLTPNGDIDGMACCEAMEWDIRYIGNGPGPNEYMTGEWCAGRRLSDFQQAGREIPRLAAA